MVSQDRTLDKNRLSLYTKSMRSLTKRKFIAGALLSLLPYLAFAIPDHGKILWKFSEKSPCVFSHKDGTPYDNDILVCYYMLANLKDPVAQFNRLPTEASQKEFLRMISSKSDPAFSRLVKKERQILSLNDFKNIPRDTPSGVRLHILMMMGQRVLKDGKKACKPFLWPKAERLSYLYKTNGKRPRTWLPCMRPFYARWSILNQKAQELQSKEVARTQKRVQSLLSKIQGLKTGKVSIAEDSVHSWALSNQGRDIESPNGKEMPSLLRHFVLDQKSALPPAPHPLSESEYRQRGYFNRGYAEGMKRLKDDALLSLSHSLGLSHTVGNPQEKAKNIIYQKGGTCAVEAQYEVLKSYGQKVTPKGLAEEAFKKGYYAEVQLKSGGLIGGTFSDKDGKLLKDHGLNVQVFSPMEKPTAAPALSAELDKAVAKNGGALVGVESGRLWNDPNSSGGHQIFVTGEEVSNKNGQVLGYYINDTGTGEAARFVPKKDFDRAWRGSGYELVVFNEKT